jgi:hypothetical protein
VPRINYLTIPLKNGSGVFGAVKTPLNNLICSYQDRNGRVASLSVPYSYGMKISACIVSLGLGVCSLQIVDEVVIIYIHYICGKKSN